VLEQLPLAARVGKTLVGGVDLNKAQMRLGVEAVITFAPSANGFTASQVAGQWASAPSQQTQPSPIQPANVFAA
jgi:hypothetical protein